MSAEEGAREASTASNSSKIALGGREAGTRLDRFLVERLGVSRSQVRSLLASGAVSLEGRTLGYGDKGLSLPDEGTLEVTRVRQRHEQRALAGAELRVLAEGPGWLAVDKPAGSPVHPLSEDETGTVLNAVIARHPQIHGVGEGGLRSGVVHRLDVDTTGVLLFATRESMWRRLRDAFREHRVEKRYRAIVAGEPAASIEGPLELDLAVARHRPARVRVVDGSWHSPKHVYRTRQQLRVLERFAGAALVEVRLETGFLHQIRVSLAHLGHPVLGDALYGDAAALARGAARQMLHAARVRFEEIDVESADPDDFRLVLAVLRGPR